MRAGSGCGNDGEMTAMGPAPGVEDALELATPADPSGGWQCIGRHWLILAAGRSAVLAPAARVRFYREAVTARRFRPLARRRARTCRPFLVAMRTRNPWVRFRCRRFG